MSIGQAKDMTVFDCYASMFDYFALEVLLCVFIFAMLQSFSISFVVCFARVCLFYIAFNIFASGKTPSWRFLKTLLAGFGVFFRKKETKEQELLAMVTGIFLLMLNAYSCQNFIAIHQAKREYMSNQYVAGLKFTSFFIYCVFLFPIFIATWIRIFYISTPFTTLPTNFEVMKEVVYKKYVNEMTIYQLQSALKDRGLPVGGNKPDMVPRLLKALLQNNEDEVVSEVVFPDQKKKRIVIDPSDIASFATWLLCVTWVMIVVDIVTHFIS